MNYIFQVKREYKKSCNNCSNFTKQFSSKDGTKGYCKALETRIVSLSFGRCKHYEKGKTKRTNTGLTKKQKQYQKKLERLLG